MQQPPVEQDKSQTLDLIQSARTELEAAIANLTDDQFEASPEGGWSIKDHLAHIAAWEQSVVVLLQGKPRHEGLGIDKAVYERHDIDEINQHIYRAHAESPVDEVLARFRDSHLQMLDVLDTLTDEDLRKPYSYYLPDEPGEETGAPILDWVAGDTYRHYTEHLAVIRELTGA